MADEKLYCVRINDRSGDFDLSAELISALEFEFSSYFDREAHITYHTIYTLAPDIAIQVIKKLEDITPQWEKEFGVELFGFQVYELTKTEWAEAWKKYFTAIPISDRLLIKPSWVKYDSKPGQKVVTLDPGMSFGTGQHATTLFCLQKIDQLADLGKNLSFLDAGTGSGILSIAAVKLGFSPVDAFDFDPDAIRVAKENLILNKITNVTPTVGDAADYQGRDGGYDLVCANILGHLLRAYRKNIVSWVKPAGFLALAGILTEDFEKLSDDFLTLGFKEVERVTLREWTSGLFQRY